MLSHKKLVMLPIALVVVVSLLVANVSHGNKTVAQNISQQVSATTPAMSAEDEPNGDDGTSIQQDLKKLNESNSQLDDHQFYKPEYIKDRERAMSFWVDFSKLPSSQSTSARHEMLSKSYRRAAPIRLTFDFPFYGQPLRNIIVATGGFLYVGEHIHHWLAATQNISPLMANFDLSMSNYSDIYHHDNGTSLVVQWKDVQMKDNKPPGNFSFQVTLHKNGDIVFVYNELPVAINEIPEVEHPVKVGISDAFLIDKVAFFIRRKTIYDYHRLNLKDVPEIKNNSAIYLKALPTCNQYDTCGTCAKAPPSLSCIWCPAVKRCSNGFDRKRQEWLSNSCERITKSDCTSKVDVTPSSSSSTVDKSNSMISVESNTSRQMVPDRGDTRAAEGGTAFVTFLMFLALTSGVGLWAFYAYRNPHTPSGQLLIKYRPGNWRWQNAETRYTAASIHM
uniref:Plexin domain-containing protein 1 n=1 Tax=Aceria tosichella TaxID=561515 RepID=A0A6G1SAJ2_9ACAR